MAIKREFNKGDVAHLSKGKRISAQDGIAHGFMLPAGHPITIAGFKKIEEKAGAYLYSVRFAHPRQERLVELDDYFTQFDFTTKAQWEAMERQRVEAEALRKEIETPQEDASAKPSKETLEEHNLVEMDTLLSAASAPKKAAKDADADSAFWDSEELLSTTRKDGARSWKEMWACLKGDTRFRVFKHMYLKSGEEQCKKQFSFTEEQWTFFREFK